MPGVARPGRCAPRLTRCTPAAPADDADEGGDFFFDEQEVAAGAGDAERAAALQRFDAMLQIDPGRFADEDEEYEEGEEEEEEGEMQQ